MSLQAVWANEDCTIILITIEGVWSWQDMRVLREQCVRMLNSVPHEVDFIIDQGEANWFPEGYRTSVRRLLKGLPDNIGNVVVSSSNALARQLFHIFVGLVGGRMRFRYYFTQSTDEAWELLKKLRSDG